jgi:WD40 repeat protein
VWSRAGGLVAVATTDGTLSIYDPSVGHLRSVESRPEGSVSALAGDASGIAARLAVVAGDGSVLLLEPDRRTEPSRLTTLRGKRFALAFGLVDGRSVLAIADGPRVRLWDVAAERRLPDPLESGKEPVLALTWPTGAGWLAGMTPTRVLLWQVGGRPLPDNWVENGQVRPTSIAAAPDGERLAIGYDDGTVQIVRVGREEAR